MRPPTKTGICKGCLQPFQIGRSSVGKQGYKRLKYCSNCTDVVRGALRMQGVCQACGEVFDRVRTANGEVDSRVYCDRHRHGRILSASFECSDCHETCDRYQADGTREDAQFIGRCSRCHAERVTAIRYSQVRRCSECSDLFVRPRHPTGILDDSLQCLRCRPRNEVFSSDTWAAVELVDPASVVAIKDHDWMKQGQCLGRPDLFFAGNRSSDHAAKLLCATCPVLRQCQSYIAVNPEPAGVWAGTTPAERGVEEEMAA